MTKKVTTVFLYVLAVISIIGYSVIAIQSFLGVDLGRFTPPILMIILGFGFIIEGRVFFWKRMFRRGFDSNDFAKLVTGSVGILAILIGLLGFFLTGNVVFNTMMGILSLVAILVIAVEVLLVN